MPRRSPGPASPQSHTPYLPLSAQYVHLHMSHRHCRCCLLTTGHLIFTVPLPSIFSSSVNPPSCLSRNLGIALDSSLFLNLDSNASGNHNCSASKISPLSTFPATTSTPLAWTTARTFPVSTLPPATHSASSSCSHHLKM